LARGWATEFFEERSLVNVPRRAKDSPGRFVENLGEPQTILKIQPRIIAGTAHQAADACGVDAERLGQSDLRPERLGGAFEIGLEVGLRHGQERKRVASRP